MEKFYKGMGKMLVFLVAGMIMAFPSTFMIMLALGILHDRYEVVPALGYWETYVVYVAINAVGSAIKTGIKPAAEKA